MALCHALKLNKMILISDEQKQKEISVACLKILSTNLPQVLDKNHTRFSNPARGLLSIF